MGGCFIHLVIPFFRSSKAFKAMGDTVAKTMYAAFEKDPKIFTKKEPITDEDDFRDEFFFDLKDFHKTAIQR